MEAQYSGRSGIRLATVAVARLVLGPRMHVQAPPNLVAGEYARSSPPASTTGVASRRSPPTTSTPSALAPDRRARRGGRASRLRLARTISTVYPEYLGEPWLDLRTSPVPHSPRRPATTAARVPAPATGGRGRSRTRSRRPAARDLHVAIDTEGRRSGYGTTMSTAVGRAHGPAAAGPARRRRSRPR